MAPNCWFREDENFKNYLSISRDIILAKMQSKPKEEKKNEKSDGKAEGSGSAFGIGMAYGSTDSWEERYVKASNNEIAKATLERLYVLQVLANIESTTKRFREGGDLARTIVRVSDIKWLESNR